MYWIRKLVLLPFFTAAGLLVYWLAPANVFKTQDLEVVNSATIGGDAHISGSVGINHNLGVGGDAGIAGSLGVGRNVGVGVDLRVNGDAGIGGSLTISGNNIVAGNETVSGDASVSGNLGVAGFAAVNGNAIVGGDAGVAGAVTVGGITDSVGIVLARAGIKLSSATGPTIQTIATSPIGVTSGTRGDLRIRTDVATVYQNTNGATGWFDLTAVFTSVLNGLVPASGGGTTSYLRADGQWSPLVSFVPSMFGGTGLDGPCAFDGVTTPVAGATLSGSTYSMTRDSFCTTAVVGGSVIVKGLNHRLFASVSITNNGNVNCNGNSATTSVAGTGIAAGFFGLSTGGGTGGTNGGGSLDGGGASGVPNFPGAASSIAALGRNGNTGLPGDVPMRGGGGGTAVALTGQSGGTMTIIVEGPTVGGGFGLYELQRGRISFSGTTGITAASGGGGGRSAAAGQTGGGGGGGACTLYVESRSCLGSGTYTATGGAGANASATPNSGGGGGGGGGVTAVICGVAAGTWTATATGGSPGNGTGTGFAGGAGANGFVITPVTP